MTSCWPWTFLDISLTTIGNWSYKLSPGLFFSSIIWKCKGFFWVPTNNVFFFLGDGVFVFSLIMSKKPPIGDLKKRLKIIIPHVFSPNDYLKNGCQKKNTICWSWWVVKHHLSTCFFFKGREKTCVVILIYEYRLYRELLEQLTPDLSGTFDKWMKNYLRRWDLIQVSPDKSPAGTAGGSSPRKGRKSLRFDLGT